MFFPLVSAHKKGSFFKTKFKLLNEVFAHNLIVLHHQLFFFKDIIYLFDRERDSQRESKHKQGGAEEEAGSQQRSLIWGSILGIWDHALSRRQTLNDWVTQAPQ